MDVRPAKFADAGRFWRFLVPDQVSSGMDSTPRNILTPQEIALDGQIREVRGRIIDEATLAVGMLEASVEALVNLDVDKAREIIIRDDEIDRSEVEIEESLLRVLALYHPFAKDFRKITSLLRVNADLERVADHATSISKQTIKLKALGITKFPTALIELGQRVPMLCHALLSGFVSENVEQCRTVIIRDRAIDSLDKRLFEECLQQMGSDHNSKAAGMLMYRCGRELERVGDLMGNIAEDVIYLVGGHIVRHQEKRRLKREGLM